MIPEHIKKSLDQVSAYTLLAASFERKREEAIKVCRQQIIEWSDEDDE